MVCLSLQPYAEAYFNALRTLVEGEETKGHKTKAREYCLMLAGAASLVECLGLCQQDIVKSWEHYVDSKSSALSEASSDSASDAL